MLLLDAVSGTFSTELKVGSFLPDTLRHFYSLEYHFCRMLCGTFSTELKGWLLLPDAVRQFYPELRVTFSRNYLALSLFS